MSLVETVETLDTQLVKDLTLKEELELLINKKLEYINEFKAEIVKLKALQKKCMKKKKDRDYSNIKKNGFNTPIVLTNELYTFLLKTNATMRDPTYSPTNEEEYNNWPLLPVEKGVGVSRTDITKHFSKYIKEKNLQNKNNKREFVPDNLMKKILSPSDTYKIIGLQTYIKQHFKTSA